MTEPRNQKRVFVTVGTTCFDELTRAATEEEFLKVPCCAEVVIIVL